MATMEVTYDHDSEHLNPNEDDCPLFKLHSFNQRHNSFAHPDDLQRLYGNDGIAFVLSYYEHGLGRWYRNGDGSDAFNMDPGGWDTVSVAGVLTIEDREWWDEQTPERRQEAADAWLTYYTDWMNGNVYFVEAWRDLPDTVCSEGATHHHRETIFDACGGYVGDSGLKDAEGEVRFMLKDGEELEVILR